MKSSKIFFTLLVTAVGLYLGYKISGKTILAGMAVMMIVISGIYRIIYDWRHDSFPWKKTEEGKRAEERNRLEKAQKKAERINRRMNKRK